jgi:hypothetical protein
MFSEGFIEPDCLFFFQCEPCEGISFNQNDKVLLRNSDRQ